MNKKFEVKILETTEELNILEKKIKDKYLQKKLLFLRLIKLGKIKSIKELSECINLGRNRVSYWIKVYEEKGIIEFLKPKQTKGKVSSVPEEIIEALKEKLSTPEGFSSYYEILYWIKEKYNIEFTYRIIEYTVKNKLKASLKVARPVHYKQDKKN